MDEVQKPQSNILPRDTTQGQKAGSSSNGKIDLAKILGSMELQRKQQTFQQPPVVKTTSPLISSFLVQKTPDVSKPQTQQVPHVPPPRPPQVIPPRVPAPPSVPVAPRVQDQTVRPQIKADVTPLKPIAQDIKPLVSKQIVPLAVVAPSPLKTVLSSLISNPTPPAPEKVHLTVVAPVVHAAAILPPVKSTYAPPQQSPAQVAQSVSLHPKPLNLPPKTSFQNLPEHAPLPKISAPVSLVQKSVQATAPTLPSVAKQVPLPSSNLIQSNQTTLKPIIATPAVPIQLKPLVAGVSQPQQKQPLSEMLPMGSSVVKAPVTHEEKISSPGDDVERVKNFVDAKLEDEGFFGKNPGTTQVAWKLIENMPALTIVSGDMPSEEQSRELHVDHRLHVGAYQLVRDIATKMKWAPREGQTAMQFLLSAAGKGPLF